MNANHVYVITHTDLDGVGAAAATLRILGRKPGRDSTVVFTEPYELHEILDNLEDYMERGDLIIITDLGLNEDTKKQVIEVIGELTSKGISIEWYDHHVWDPDDVRTLSEIGVKIWVDRSTCATGVASRYASMLRNVNVDSFLLELEDVVCSADLWRWNNSLSPKLFRAAGSREASNTWRLKALEKFLEGILWDEELERRLENYVNEELKNMKVILSSACLREAGGIRIVAAYKENGPPANSIVAAALMSRYRADIAAIIRPNGGISLRSKRVNVQKIALKLGGGGHPKASGARIGIPVWVKILKVITPKAISYYGARVVSKAVGKDVELIDENVKDDHE